MWMYVNGAIRIMGLLISLPALAACADHPLDAGDGITVDSRGALHFPSHQVFFDTVTAVGHMTEAELDDWEDRRGFVSHRREYERVMRFVAAAQTPADGDAILAANDDLVEVVGDTAEPRIHAFGYSAIVNRSGIFYVDGVVHRVLPDVVISADDGRLETIDVAVAALKSPAVAPFGEISTPAPGVRVVSYRGSRLEQEQELVPNGCTDYKSAFYNTSDRKIDIDIWVYDYYCAGCCGNYYHQVFAEGRMRGYKKNWLGNWTDNYSTQFTYDSLEFEVNAPRVLGYTVGNNGLLTSVFDYQSYTVSGGSGTSPGDWVTWHFGSWSLGHQVQNSGIAAPYFNRVKVRGKSRGTGTNGWAEICCGYAQGCNFPPACVPRTWCYAGECGYVSDNCGGTLYCSDCGGGGGGGGGGCLVEGYCEPV